MKQKIAELLFPILKNMKIKIEKNEIMNLIEIPPSQDLGDFSIPCFYFSKLTKKNPHELALEIRTEIGNKGKQFQDIQVQGPYLNFFLDRKMLALNLIKEINSKKDSYGSLPKNTNKTMIEFSQANTHKAFHVGHIRGTSIGESLARILEFSGDKVIRANYQGDTGMHVAKWLWCYMKYHSKEKIKKQESWIASIYVDAVKRLEADKKNKGKKSTFQKEVEDLNRELEIAGDKKILNIWYKTRKQSLEAFEKIYKILDTKFDYSFFESQVEEQGKKISLELLEKGIAEKSQGATIVNLEKYNLGVWVLLRSDNTVLYSAKDLALFQEKLNKFKINKNVYVVGAAQSLHIQQLFKTLELMNSPIVDKSKHISYAEVRLPTGKMSSRTGENILFSEFMQELNNEAKKQIKKRFPKLSKIELEKRAEKISISALKYSFLKQHPNKLIIFDKKEALNFEGDSGPYLLYSYARASSILRKLKNSKTKKNSNFDSLEDKEIELVKKLNEFKDIVEKSYINLNPALIANYSYQLCKIFNEFYHLCPVLNSEKEFFRIKLVKSFRQVLKNSLNLLGIKVLEKM